MRVSCLHVTSHPELDDREGMFLMLKARTLGNQPRGTKYAECHRLLVWGKLKNILNNLKGEKDWQCNILDELLSMRDGTVTTDLDLKYNEIKYMLNQVSTDFLLVLHCEGPSVPHTVLYSIPDGEVVFYIHSNPQLQILTSKMAWPIIKTFRVRLEDGAAAKVQLSIPPEYENNDGKTYPVLVSAPGPPGEQMINHKWHVNWNTYLATNKSWVVVEIDGRGSGGQELGLIFQPSWQLGKLEALDYLQVTRYLISELKFLDNSRVAVWGWGHAGFNAITTLAADHHATLSCAASVATPTDWTQYSSYYSEKYMGSSNVVPGGNFRGYEETSLLNRAGELRNRTLMLLHGTADIDVHYSHSLRLTKELTKYNALFRAQAYTDEGHDLKGVQHHLYSTMEIFLQSCFPPYTQDEIDLATGT
ncbi:unnamed protein product, partial [Meganyctiphanes norvegica]